MTGRIADRFSYANVTATAALFVALGGTSYAAVKLPKDSVGNGQLRASAVRSAEVKDRALEVRDLSMKARESLRGLRGLTGPAGPAGGGSSFAGGGAFSVSYKTEAVTIAADSVNSRTVICDAGQRAIGGGIRVDTGIDTSLRESYPNPSFNNTAWTVRVGNDTIAPAPPATYTAFAICTTG